jgi:DNA polymerase/3'-5' exonuclease PolX
MSYNMNATSIATFIVNLEKQNKDLHDKIKTLEEENIELHIQLAEYHLESDTESVASNDYESETESETDSDFFVSYNSDLTDVFDKLASYEEDPHKRNAYRNAADAIYKLPFEVKSGSELATGPMKVPGIGKSIAKKIDEFLETGKIKRLEELEKPTSTNDEIAWHLDVLASLEAEPHGSQDSHKIRAYRRAAEIIREINFEVTSGMEIAKGPKKIEGIGAGIGKKIDEFLQTGKIQRIEDLSK